MFLPSHSHRRAIVVTTLLLIACGVPLGAQTALERTLAEAAAAANEGDLKGAVAKLEAVRLNPLGESMLGKLYVELGRGEEALALLAPLADRSDANAPVLVDAARAAVLTGDPIRAGKWLNRALVIEPEGSAQREMGVLLGGLGEHRDAYPLLIAWVRSNPADSTARILAALSASELGRNFEMEQLLEGLPSEDPRVGLLRGQMLLSRGDGEAAAATLQPLLANAPTEMLPKIRSTLADAYLEADRPMAAIDLIEGNVGDDIQLALKLSEAFEAAGFEPSAASAIQRFVEPLKTRLEELPPEIAESAADLAARYGALKLRGGEFDESIAFLEIAARLNPDASTTWERLVEAQKAAGNTERAQAAQKEADRIAATPRPPVDQPGLELDDIGAALRQAMLISESSPEEALDMLKYEARVAPLDPRPLLGAARVLLHAERLPEAMVFVNRALELVPVPEAGAASDGAWRDFRTRSLSLRARILASGERFAEAVRSLEELQQIDPNYPDIEQRIQKLRASVR